MKKMDKYFNKKITEFLKDNDWSMEFCIDKNEFRSDLLSLLNDAYYQALTQLMEDLERHINRSY